MPMLEAPSRRRHGGTAVIAPHPVGGKKTVALRLAGGAFAIWGVMTLLGLLLTHVLNKGPVHAADLGVDRWFAAHRTGLRNSITYAGTTMAQTVTAIAVAAVVVLLLRWRLGRWYESLVMITVMAGELLIFLCVTLVVHRPRPPVVRLEAAPETSSFPSGHTAAAVALYGCIAILVLWIYGRRPATRAVVAVLCCIPVIVGLSRLYRGMHYPSDVLAGALTGGLWLLIVITTLLPQRSSRPRGIGPRGTGAGIRQRSGGTRQR